MVSNEIPEEDRHSPVFHFHVGYPQKKRWVNHVNFKPEIVHFRGGSTERFLVSIIVIFELKSQVADPITKFLKFALSR